MRMRKFAWLSMAFVSSWLLLACEPSENKSESDRRVAMTVYKSPGCGCCEKWVEHMEQAGFKVRVEHPADLAPIKAQYGIGEALQACHTAVVDGYVFEGHIPAGDVQRFLKEKPANAKGLAVPKMPKGSPGMEQGGEREAYQVLLLQNDGGQAVYTQY